MTTTNDSVLRQILDVAASKEITARLLQTVRVAEPLAADSSATASRAVVAQALNLLLFDDLLNRVPTGRQYVDECLREGRRVVFDHGALRTVALEGMGSLPAGHEAMGRILRPLGYEVAGTYPLSRICMTGRAYQHLDFPEELPQFFVSELHPDHFSRPFQAAVRRVTASSIDPLSRTNKALLGQLGYSGFLSIDDAAALVPALVQCFRKQHGVVRLSDYEALLAESAEMAWIATEGNVFNHATDRIPDLNALVMNEKRSGRPLKEQIEVSRSGRVLQTAYKADPVSREFADDSGRTVVRTVPGSFYEFIERRTFVDESGRTRLDLSFDSGNAQGIFKMTAVA